MQRDGLPRVGRGLRPAARRAAGSACHQPDKADSKDRTRAPHGAHAQRTGGRAAGHRDVDARALAKDIEPVVARIVSHRLVAKQHRADAFGKAAARQLQVGADKAASHTQGDIAQRGHDLQHHAGAVALQAHVPGGGGGGHHHRERLRPQIDRRRCDRDLRQVAAVVQRGEHQPVAGHDANAAQDDALADVGRGQASLCGRTAGRAGCDALQMGGPCGKALDVQRVGSGVAARVARARYGGVVGGVAVTTHADVEGARGRRRPALGRIRTARREQRQLRQRRAADIEDAHIGVQARRVGQVQRELVARTKVHAVQVHVQRTAYAPVDLDALVKPERRVQRRGQRVAHVRGRCQVGQRGKRRSARAQRAGASGRGHRNDPRSHPVGHHQREQLLVDACAVAVDHRAHAEAAHPLAVDGDGQVVAGQPAALQHDRVARHHGASGCMQRGYDLQVYAGAAAQHTHCTGARQGRHHHAERGAPRTHRAGAREGAQRAAVIYPLELHQRAARKALALQHDGLAGDSARRERVARRARAGAGHDGGEHTDGLRPEAGVGKLRVAAFGGDADRSVQRARRHDVDTVVAYPGDVEHVRVGRGIHQHHAADGDRGAALHEARAAQVKALVLARAPGVDAGQRRHHLQPYARTGAKGLRAVGVRVVDQRLAQLAHPVHAHIDQVRPRAWVVAVPAVEHQQIKAQRVVLPRSEPAQAQRLAGVVAKAPAKAAEGGNGVAVDSGLAPRRVGRARLEVVREHRAGALLDQHVVYAPALVVQPFEPAIGKADAGRAAARGEVHRDVAVHGVGITAIEAQVARALVDHAHVARSGQHRHLHLQARSASVDDQRRLRHHARVAHVVQDVEQHPGTDTEVRAHQLDHLVHVGRGLSHVGRHAVARRGYHLRERGRGHRHRIHRRIDFVYFALSGGDPQGAVGGKRQTADLVVVHPLAGQVQPAQLAEHPRTRDLVLHQLPACIGRAQPQVPRGGIDRQPGPRLDAQRRQRHPRLHPRGCIDRHDPVARAVVLGQEDPVGLRIKRGPRQVVVGIQRQAGKHRPGGQIHRHHPVRVRMAVEHQQAARGHRRAPQRHRRPQHLQPGVVKRIRRSKVGAHRERLQHLPRARIDLQQMPRVGLVAYPQLARRVHRHIAQAGARHVHPHRI